MLSLLHIENIAVIESADIRFSGGFNALTGETGAGKSIVVDAIGAVIGERTSRDIIRTGARAALVSALFLELPSIPWFMENGLGPDEDGNLLLQREIQADGKNVCRLNGRPLTVAQLKSLGQQLLNIHGQHDGQQLLDAACHLSYLDRFGGTVEAVSAFQTAYENLSQIRREIAGLQMDETEKTRRMDSLRYQIGELERADLRPGEEDELLARRTVLRNAGKLIEAVEGAHFALSGDEDRDGAVSLLLSAEQAIAAVRSVDVRLNSVAEKLTGLSALAEDVEELVRDLRGGLDFEPGELDELEGRLDVIYRLKKKYGATIEEMLSYLERCRLEMDQMEFSKDILARLEKKRSEALTDAEKQGRLLSEERKKAAIALQTRIQRELEQLDMPKVQFIVDFAPKSGENGMDATGMDEVQFLMSANTGEALKPIQKIASGGELARIMLALKNVLAENDDVSTLVFDEVDTGVSGRAAQKVAEKMAEVARKKQVLCVTHLPQIAAMADVHFCVEKGEREGRTFTAVEKLSNDQRKEELARLTGGAHVTPAMLKGAGELLESAAAYKRGI